MVIGTDCIGTGKSNYHTNYSIESRDSSEKPGSLTRINLRIYLISVISKYDQRCSVDEGKTKIYVKKLLSV